MVYFYNPLGKAASYIRCISKMELLVTEMVVISSKDNPMFVFPTQHTITGIMKKNLYLSVNPRLRPQAYICTLT